MNPLHIPQELKDLRQWVVWKYETVPGRDKRTKVLYNASSPSYRASTTSPGTWGTYKQAAAASRSPGVNGIGFVFSKDDPYIGIDFDNCVGENEIIDPVVKGWIDSLDSYAELSPSGTGVHVIARGTVPKGIKAGGFEMYSNGRFFTVTGDKLPGCPQTATAAQDAITALFGYITALKPQTPSSTKAAQPIAALDLADSEIVRLMLAAKNGAKSRKLWAGDITGYKSQSEADLALAGILAFWTGGNTAQVERLMLASGLSRDKYQIKRGASSYLRKTVDRAIEGCTKFYTPRRSDEVWTKLKAFRAFIEGYKWEGRRGDTLQRCALAILRRFEEAHSVETYFSISQIATMAGVGTKTAQRCLHGNINQETGEITAGLKDMLPIERSQKSNGLLASTWRICDRGIARELTHYKSMNTQEEPVNLGCVVSQFPRNSNTAKQSKFVESFLNDDAFERGSQTPTRSAASMGSERSELDVTSTLSELFNREVTANKAAKSFSNLGLRIMAYLDASPTKSATAGELVQSLDKHPSTIRTALHRMSDALRIHNHEGVLELSTLHSPGNPLLATLPDDWRDRLNTARPNLCSYGKHEARLQAVAARRIMRLMTIYKWARRDDTKEMISTMIDKQRAVIAYGEGDLPRLDRLLGRIESHLIENEPEAISEMSKNLPAPAAADAPEWLRAQWRDEEDYTAPATVLIERVHLGHITDEAFAEQELIEVEV